MHGDRRSGFTLIELLVVIAIIAILAAILFPILTRAKESAKRSKCLSNLKQLSIAAQTYADSYDGFYPPGRLSNWPWGDWNTPHTYYDGINHPIGLGLRALEPYVKNKQVFFCPSNVFFKSPPYWTHTQSYWAGYSYWGNYLNINKDDVDPNNHLTREQVAVNSGQYPYSLLLSDIAVIYDSGAPHPFNSHPAKGLPEGANYLYNDGHAKWKWFKNMTKLTTKEQVTFFW